MRGHGVKVLLMQLLHIRRLCSICQEATLGIDLCCFSHHPSLYSFQVASCPGKCVRILVWLFNLLQLRAMCFIVWMTFQQGAVKTSRTLFLTFLSLVPASRLNFGFLAAWSWSFVPVFRSRVLAWWASTWTNLRLVSKKVQPLIGQLPHLRILQCLIPTLNSIDATEPKDLRSEHYRYSQPSCHQVIHSLAKQSP